MYENIMIMDGESVCDIQGLYQCFVQCHDDIGELVKNATDSVSVTGEFASVVVCKPSLCIQKLFIFVSVSTSCFASSLPSATNSISTKIHTITSSSSSAFALIIINRHIY